MTIVENHTEKNNMYEAENVYFSHKQSSFSNNVTLWHTLKILTDGFSHHQMEGTLR